MHPQRPQPNLDPASSDIDALGQAQQSPLAVSAKSRPRSKLSRRFINLIYRLAEAHEPKATLEQNLHL